MPEVVEKEPEQNQDESKLYFIMERRKYVKTEGFVTKQKNKMQHPAKQITFLTKKKLQMVTK